MKNTLDRKYCRLKIVSDGTSRGTKIIDNLGRELLGVVKIEWDISLKRTGVGRISVRDMPAEIEGEFATEVEQDKEKDDADLP